MNEVLEQADGGKQMLFWLLWCLTVASLDWSRIMRLALMTLMSFSHAFNQYLAII